MRALFFGFFAASLLLLPGVPAAQTPASNALPSTHFSAEPGLSPGDVAGG